MSKDAQNPESHDAKASERETLEYWTPERERNARPIPMPAPSPENTEQESSQNSQPVTEEGEPGEKEVDGNSNTSVD